MGRFTFILTPQRFKFSINKHTIFPRYWHWHQSWPCAYNHKLKLKTKRFTKSSRIRFDLEKLKDPKIAEVFQAEVDRKFAALCVLDSDVDTLAKSKRSATLDSEEVLEKQRKKLQPWDCSGSVRRQTAAETKEVHAH